VSGVLEGWVFLVHVELQLDQSVISASGLSTLSIFFNLDKKRGEWGDFLFIEGGKEAEDFEILFMAIVQIYLGQYKFDHSTLC
jgi:hypothetical protein